MAWVALGALSGGGGVSQTGPNLCGQRRLADPAHLPFLGQFAE
jgi:hypothetical protein